MPASAIPGWPDDVPLPSGPFRKRDHAASVRRPVRDGVDTPLASLFLNPAGMLPPEADGAVRARSASGAFLYRHLGDTVAYRRDRHKDLSLQRNGDLVLRFLAEDVGKELGAVLDAILQSLRRC